MCARNSSAAARLRGAKSHILLIFLLISWCINLGTTANARPSGRGGTWELLLNSTGAVAMHMALSHRDTVVIFDQLSAGPSGLRMPGCSPDDDYKPSCWAHSVEYDVAGNAIRPLALITDPWCSSGAFLSDGVLAQTGGYADGYRRIRHFVPSSDPMAPAEWIESRELLADNRWYSSDQILPERDDRVFVVGGRNAFTYEFVPKSSPGEGAFQLPFLRQTYDRAESGDNLYPFVHVSSDGNLFIFANRDSILFDYRNNRVVKSFPTMPGEGSRSYPSTGSSVMLPLDHSDGFRKAEVMVCGGAAAGAYRASKRGEFYRGLSSCGRLVVTDDEPSWAMEDMPGPRLMSDMLLLPTGHVLLINGATHGCAGWKRAKNSSYSPYLYKPNVKAGERFSVLNPSSIARMYHSTAILLPDGRVLVGGSNPQKKYTFDGVPYPTELRLEAFTPYYMGSFFDNMRPWNLSIQYGDGGVRYGEEFGLRFQLGRRPGELEFVVYAPPFATHSQSMNQRMLRLECRSLVRERSDGVVQAVLVAPPSATAAPAGFYLLTVVNGGFPSKSQWLRFVYE